MKEKNAPFFVMALLASTDTLYQTLRHVVACRLMPHDVRSTARDILLQSSRKGSLASALMEVAGHEPEISSAVLRELVPLAEGRISRMTILTTVWPRVTDTIRIKFAEAVSATLRMADMCSMFTVITLLGILMASLLAGLPGSALAPLLLVVTTLGAILIVVNTLRLPYSFLPAARAAALAVAAAIATLVGLPVYAVTTSPTYAACAATVAAVAAIHILPDENPLDVLYFIQNIFTQLAEAFRMGMTITEVLAMPPTESREVKRFTRTIYRVVYKHQDAEPPSLAAVAGVVALAAQYMPSAEVFELAKKMMRDLTEMLTELAGRLGSIPLIFTAINGLGAVIFLIMYSLASLLSGQGAGGFPGVGMLISISFTLSDLDSLLAASLLGTLAGLFFLSMALPISLRKIFKPSIILAAASVAVLNAAPYAVRLFAVF